MTYSELNGHTIEEGFLKFHKENPKVYEAFKVQALKAINLGRKKLSAKLIINVIRWNVFLETSDENFKINDAFQSYYARLFANEHPQYKECFEFRKQRSKDDAPYIFTLPDGQLGFY